jgi:fatty acid desaturase
MKNLPEVITDPVYHEPARVTAYERFWFKRINDKRDLPFINLLVLLHLTVIPVAIILYTPLLKGWMWWVALIPYFYFSQFYFKGSFGLMLHCLCHRKIFRKHNLLFSKYLYWFVCPFFGHLGDSYFVHHIAMHHVENNMPSDASSTMAYKRDSPKDFLKYWGRFMVLGFRDTFHYFFARKRKKFYVRLTISEVGFMVIVAALCFLNFRATLFVLIIPFLFARLVMMLGNWTQHAFVDPEEPNNDLASTIICLNTVYNKKCWNDGYHAVHHIRPAAHYTEFPEIFRKITPDLIKNKTLVFENIHYLHIFTWLMTKRYDKLAANLVNINGAAFSNEEEAIALMKKRTRKLNPSHYL